MDLRVNRPHRNGTNGTYETPHLLGGVSSTSAARRAQPTVFPDDSRLAGGAAIFYALDRFQLGGITVGRYLAFLILAMAVVWASGLMPARWPGLVFWLLLFLGYWAWSRHVRHSDYVYFAPSPPLAGGQPLLPNEKIAVHATGQFSVEGKYQRFTWLPGFYRTFATGEHAVLCQVRARRWGQLAQWPPDEVGMWYAFFEPSAIREVRWGELHFGRNRAPALAVSYNLTIPASDRRKRDLVRPEVLYLAVQNEADARRLFADLLQHMPAPTPQP